MAFGNSRQEERTKETTQKFDPIYLNSKQGKRVIRILGSEVSYKVYWLEVNVAGKDDTISKGQRPVIVAVYRDGEWLAHEDDDNWYENPYQAVINALPEEKQKGLYARTRFVVNVYDRTPVALINDLVVYPDDNGQYISGSKEQPTTEPHNKIMLLEGSSGKVGGKHMLQKIMNISNELVSYSTGKPVTLADADIQMITNGQGIDTDRSFIPGMNQLPIEYAHTDLYDLESFIKPWPHVAINALLTGAEYNATRDEYKLPAFAKKFES